MQSKRAEVRIIDTTILSEDWYSLKKYTFEVQRHDGEWQRQNREAYDRGNGATILLYNRDKRTVILTRQFRFPVYLNGHDGYLIETAAGLLDNMDPESRIKAEAEEETGYRVERPQKVFEGINVKAPTPLLLIAAVAFFASWMLGNQSFWLSYALLVIAAACMYAPYGPFFALIPELLPRNVSGVSMGMINSFGALGAFLGAWLVGYLNGLTGGPGVSYTFMACALLASVVLMYNVRAQSDRSSSMSEMATR
jgi:hypothetical protein